jgi:hypothetical protein
LSIISSSSRLTTVFEALYVWPTFAIDALVTHLVNLRQLLPNLCRVEIHYCPVQFEMMSEWRWGKNWMTYCSWAIDYLRDMFADVEEVVVEEYESMFSTIFTSSNSNVF